MLRLILIGLWTFASLIIFPSSFLIDNNSTLSEWNLPSLNLTKDEIARRGCCSHHGGVCGCQDGRALCCDETLSPSCGCWKDSGEEDIVCLNRQFE
ncbi:MAG: hypothetical protein KDK66_03490 [Deltaproteobacteria bacterium]|nr:hypothetical protein [Deltaproteobacteria bacterium]